MNTFDISKKICDYLKSFQVNDSNENGHKICIERYGNKKSVINYFKGAIMDEIDKECPGEHYGTSHYALLAMLIYQKNNKEIYFESAIEAMEFQIRTRYYFKYANGGNHRDFNNLAIVEFYILLNRLRPNHPLNQKLKFIIHTLIPHNNSACNWIAMRCLQYYLLANITSRNLLYKYKAKKELGWLLSWQDEEGCFHDAEDNSKPIQYHAYAVALIYKIWEITNNNEVYNAFIKGINWLCAHFDNNGDFNYSGRGQRQIFGYPVAIYSLLCAFYETDSKYYLELANKCLAYICKYQKQDGSFPLVLNDLNDTLRSGWYDYHHKSVYNAFAGLWLMLIDSKSPSLNIENKNKNKFQITKEGIYKYPVSGDLVYKKNNFFFSIAKGSKTYEADCGFTFQHLVYKNDIIFTCPAGPGKKYGKRATLLKPEINTFAPIVYKSEQILWCGSSVCEINQISDSLFSLNAKCGDFQINRKISINSNSIKIKDLIELVDIDEIKSARVINIPVQKNEYILDRNQVIFKNYSIITFIDNKIANLGKKDTIYVANGEIDILSYEIIKNYKSKYEVEINIEGR